ncbi:acyltransferase family protein [Cytobacillus solani]|uniref:Acyltransferase 3 domain-containing protein n=1 Tax=Cytobacillus solani TaxID=1637975 RepID=A0A0Q3SFG7_9BACI|nr:acyltransferase [Cytobacillus solani]KQL17980.1 hypothetical protein AN957_04720 [Cytobacillus solani]USK55806.1 acyltransferase [Cytobacillus solani]
MRKHLNLIQFSRAFVPIFVILFHVKAFMLVYFHYNFLMLPDILKSGGVYYFFALSGFMAYYLYHNKFGNREMIKYFLYSRFIRIYPVYWIVTISVLVVMIVFPSLAPEHQQGMEDIIFSLLLIPNGSNLVLGVAWSLVHTVFFYLIFTIAFFKKSKFSITAAILWAMISFAFSIQLFNSSNILLNYLFNSYNLIFLSGIACAYIVLKVRINLYVSWILVIIGVAAFPLSWINAQYGYAALNIEIATTIASVFIIIGFSSIDLQKDVKIPKIAQYLGDASFSIYLTHYYCISALTIIFLQPMFNFLSNIVIAILFIVISVICGCFVYSFIEKPLNKRLKPLLKRNQRYDSKSIVKELKENAQ